MRSCESFNAGGVATVVPTPIGALLEPPRLACFYLYTYLSIYLSIYLYTYLSIYTSTYIHINKRSCESFNARGVATVAPTPGLTPPPEPPRLACFYLSIYLSIYMYTYELRWKLLPIYLSHYIHVNKRSCEILNAGGVATVVHTPIGALPEPPRLACFYLSIYLSIHMYTYELRWKLLPIYLSHYIHVNKRSCKNS